MQSTKAVRSLKKLFEGYHEPTLSKQQSQKLLDGLKTSFRGHLDREYGQTTNAEPASKTSDTAYPSYKQQRRSAAHKHLKDLLSNPMFNHHIGENNEKASATASTRDPMEVFDAAVFRGMMTLGAATGIMRAKRLELQNTPAQSPDVGLRVVQWLQSSRSASDLAFLDNSNFVSALVPFLVMENMDKTIWEWFDRLVRRDGDLSLTRVQMKAAAGLLRELVMFKGASQERNSVGDAISSLLHADESLPSTDTRNRVLPQSWRSISWLATVDNFKTTKASERLYDAHIATSSHFNRSVEIELAHLHLYHPTHPDHVPALELFKNTTYIRNVAQKYESVQSQPVSLPPWIVVLGHDTMNFLMRAGKTEEAGRLAELLKSGLSSLFDTSESLASLPNGASKFAPP